MNLSITIQRIISALLIVVFAIGITPVAILHTLSANHTDISYADKNQQGDQYAKAGVSCKTIDFVAEAQFLAAPGTNIAAISKPLSVYNSFFASTFYSRHHFYAALRGPPVAG
ncbi:MAG: hypothetical protein ABIU77_00685 [Ferruginibacter sp.]